MTYFEYKICQKKKKNGYSIRLIEELDVLQMTKSNQNASRKKKHEKGLTGTNQRRGEFARPN